MLYGENQNIVRMERKDIVIYIYQCIGEGVRAWTGDGPAGFDFDFDWSQCPMSNIAQR
jgi:hypothetical protein